MNKSKTGFKLNIKTQKEYLYYLYKIKAHLNPVKTHYNSETNTSNIHHFMYLAQKEGYVSIKNISVENNDTLFEVTLTLKGQDYLADRINIKRIWYFTIISVIIGIIAIIVDYYT